MPRVFISYKRADKDKVMPLKDKIEAAIGEPCWIDLDGIESDAWFINVIMKAINESSIFLFMYSLEHSQITDFERDYTVREINFAQKKKKRIVFINIDNTPLSDWFEFMYGLQQQVDATSMASFGRLLKDLKRWLDIQTTTPLPMSKPQINGEDYIIKIGNIPLKMIRVEGGRMIIGATEEQCPEADQNEFPSHEIKLNSFYMSQYPITQNVWEQVMGYNKSVFKDNPFINEMKGALPVETLTYDEAQEFVRRLSKMTNIQFSLPTEEEWEYAARGGKKSQGYRFAGSDNIDDVAWYSDNSNRRTHPVGEKRPNELGIYDMSGNVWEWTETAAHTYGIALSVSGDMYVRRGGSWCHEATNCRVSKRYVSHRSKKTRGLGLRIVIRENIE